MNKLFLNFKNFIPNKNQFNISRYFIYLISNYSLNMNKAYFQKLKNLQLLKIILIF